MAIVKPEQLSSGPYNISGSFSGSFQGDGSQLSGIVSSKWSGSNPITRDGNVEITGSLNVTSGITGSLFGVASTASYVLNAVSSSYAGVANSVNDLNQNVFVSGTLTVLGGATIYGSSSFQYITASQLDVSASFISVNVFEPAQRFGGLIVYDSGSSQATASLAWDSLHNHWVYQNVSGATYTGGMFLSGPRNTGSLGDEPNLTQWFIPRGDGGDHLNNSQIYSSGSTHIVTGSLTVTQGVTGSLLGTASYATQALSASFAPVTPPFPYTGSALITGSLGVTGSFIVSSSIGNLISVSSSQIILNGPGGTAFTPTIALRRNGTDAFYIDQYGSKFNDIVYLNTIYAPGTSGITLGNQSGGGKIIYAVPTQGTLAIGYTTQTTNAALDVRAQGTGSSDIAFLVRNNANTANIVEILGDTTTNFRGALRSLTSTSVGIGVQNNFDTTNTTSGIEVTRPTAGGGYFSGNGNMLFQFQSQTRTNTYVQSSGEIYSRAAKTIYFADTNGGAFSGNQHEFHVANTGIAGAATTASLKMAVNSSGVQVTGSLGVTGSASILAFTSSAANILTIRNSANSANLINIQGDNIGNFSKVYFDLNSGAPQLYNTDTTAAAGSSILLGTATISLRDANANFVRFIGGGVRSVAVSNGAANTGLADAFEMYSADRNGVAGKASPHFRTEDGTIVWLGDESRLFNITASRTTLSASNATSNGPTLTVYGSGSSQPVFTVQGSQGELFSVTDSLSGSLFSVNDISGLPILEVFSDNTTLMGSYLDPMLITTTKITQTNSGSFTVYSLPTASYDTAFFEYSIKSGSNARAGTIMAIQAGSTVNFTETTTTDIGNTTAVSFTVFVTGSNMALTGSSTTGAWVTKCIIRGI